MFCSAGRTLCSWEASLWYITTCFYPQGTNFAFGTHSFSQSLLILMVENFAVSTDRFNQQQILLHRQVIFLTVYFLPLQSTACSIQIKNLAVDTFPNEPTARALVRLCAGSVW
jgi:hypothetical protein